MIFDGAFSIVISAISAILYTSYGIFMPLYFSLLFSAVSIITISFLWDENTANDNIWHTKYSFLKARSAISQEERSLKQDNNDSFSISQVNNENNSNNKTFSAFYNQLKDSLQELKKKEVLYIGIIESIMNSSWGLFLFSWTPLLNDLSIKNHVNVGFTYICFVMALIGGAILYEIFIIKLRKSYYKVLFVAILIQIICFLVIVYTRSFYICLINLAFVNGMIGFTSPLFSIIKSSVIIEKFRSQIMSLFRVPLNIYVITLLLMTHYLSSTKVRFIIIKYFIIILLLLIILIRLCLYPR